MKNLDTILDEVRKTRFWGSVQVDFQDGRAVLVRKTETTKLTEGNNPQYATLSK